MSLDNTSWLLLEVETPEAPVDKNGFSVTPAISDEECIRRCLLNAPAGINQKLVKRILEQLNKS